VFGETKRNLPSIEVSVGHSLLLIQVLEIAKQVLPIGEVNDYVFQQNMPFFGKRHLLEGTSMEKTPDGQQQTLDFCGFYS
jgi:hypothetical protein